MFGGGLYSSHKYIKYNMNIFLKIFLIINLVHSSIDL